ncbi:MAG: HD domain-containing protein [bacterium]
MFPGLATPAAVAAREVASAFYSPALFNHCERTYAWAVHLAEASGLAYDDELLYVGALLHDLGLTSAFDHHALAFEHAGGHVAWAFAAGAGWPAHRRTRLAEVIVRHMADAVDPAVDPEGHLLETATGLDISGRGAGEMDPQVRAAVLARWPRLNLAEQFTAAFVAEGRRKPHSAAAAALAAGIATRIAANPLEQG